MIEAVSEQQGKILEALNRGGEQLLWPTVLKVGGSLAGEQDSLLEDVAFLRQKGRQLVIVHGGGRDINEALDKEGIKTPKIDGQRVTDERTLGAVVEVLDGINRQIVNTLQKLGIRAVRFESKSALLSAKISKPELGLVGNNVDLLRPYRLIDCLDQGYVPVIAPIAVMRGNKGQYLNVNGDTAAGAVAGFFRRANFVLATDVPGVQDATKRVIPRMDSVQYALLRQAGVISEGMIPKTEAAMRVVVKGGPAIICSGDNVMTAFTDNPQGTVIESGVEKAQFEDIQQIHLLIEAFASRKLMLSRSPEEIFNNLSDYFVLRDKDKVVGCAALHRLGDTAEVRAVAVDEQYRGGRLGRVLVYACLNEAEVMGLNRVFLLTYIPKYFEGVGFSRGGIESIPQDKLLGECSNCPKAPFPQCEEVPMTFHIAA